MQLPSNVPRYDTVPLVAFDFLERRYARPVPHRRLRSWVKVAEVERRLDHFEWLAHVARDPQGISSFVGDLATAYLLSFESALQLLQEEKFAGTGLNKWLATVPYYDLLCRGIRTMRHLEAHIRAGRIAQRREGGHSRFTGGEGGSNIGWQWAPIEAADHVLLRKPEVPASELSDWNQQLEQRLAMEIMRDGLARLVKIYQAAEK